uniref:Uncharacterized protein n=1 Tax=viral metagenome TaxID=1070528 RepID=A0A6M3XPR6_9ZZZZ
MPKGPAANIEAQVENEITAQEPKTAPSTPAEPIEPTPTPDDPEVELEGGKKVKMSDLKKGYMMQSDYTTKTQALAEQRKEVEELVNLANYLKANPKKLERIIAILDEKGEAITEKKEEIKDELEGLDPDDPYAKVLKKQSEMLSKALNQIEEMKQGQERTQQQTLVQQAQQVLTKTLEDTAKGFQFADDEDKSLWRQMVLSYLKDNPKQYADEADFTGTIQQVGKKYFDALTKVGEKKIAAYVQSKGGKVPTAPATPGSPIKKKPSMDNLDELILDELEKAEKENK